MADKNSAVFGVYSTPAALEAALEALRAKGFRNADISVLSVPHPAFPVMTPGIPAPAAPAAPSAASSVGGALGWLVGLSALAMAGGVFIVAGPIMAGLARMGEAVGNVAGALAGFGVPETEAKHYEKRIASGGILLSVHTDDAEWFGRGKSILEETGAEAITTVSPLLA